MCIELENHLLFLRLLAFLRGRRGISVLCFGLSVAVCYRSRLLLLVALILLFFGLLFCGGILFVLWSAAIQLFLFILKEMQCSILRKYVCIYSITGRSLPPVYNYAYVYYNNTQLIVTLYSCYRILCACKITWIANAIRIFKNHPHKDGKNNATVTAKFFVNNQLRIIGQLLSLRLITYHKVVCLQKTLKQDKVLAILSLKNDMNNVYFLLYKIEPLSRQEAVGRVSAN